MANEILRRNPTSTGNRRVFTWAGWVKINKPSTLSNTIWYAASSGSSEFQISLASATGALNVYDYAPSAYQYQYVTSRLLRDFSNWFHLIVAVDTTQFREDDRFKIYINGTLYNGTYSGETTIGGINYQTRMNTPGEINYIGQNVAGGSSYDANCELTDLFMIDGQALTPDVFGFYKQGKGYISVGSTQSTDFRPGQWVPKTPRVIKTEINRRGGFGVNGFYLPMNDSKNFGADFHCDPNSIITLNEKLPQPRVGVASTAVGIGYTDALRADPYAANLVLALPFVSGGLSSGFGDYSAVIKGSGSAKTITNNTAVSIANTHGYYGSAAQFNGSHYLSIPTNTDFDFGTGDFTIEYWANYQTLSPALSDTIMGGTSTGCFGVYMSTSQWGFVSQNQAALQLSSGTIVGTNQFNHFAVVRKGNTLTGYLNGVAGAASTTWTYNMTNTGLGIGAQNNGTNKITGYLQDLRIYKGVAKYTGGFDVPRPYTPVGIATWRAVPDTTANNFATLNPLSSNGLTLSGGNLDASISAANDRFANATVGIPTTGKWYFEVRQNTLGATYLLYTGIRDLSTSYNAMVYPRVGNTCFYINNTANCITETNVAGDIWAVAVNMDTGVVDFYKNGVLYSGQSKTVTLGIQYFPFLAFGNVSQTGSINFGQNPTFSGNTSAGTFTDSNGKGLFKYQPPSGFLALCEDNLPKPAIEDPGKYFKTVLWTGDGNSGRSIVGVGFTPDLVWIKSRSPSAYNHRAFDSVRGAGKDNFLMPNSTAVEGASSDYYGGISSFNNDGFSMVYGTGGSNIGINESGTNFVAWCWRAGAGTTSTNTNGSIPSVVSVNQTAGFSIVSWTASGSTSTIGHGLGKVPKFIIAKSRTSIDYGWTNYHTSLGKDAYIMLYSTNASASSSNYWGTSSPSTTVFGVAPSAFNNNSGNMIAYCWAEIEGFSKFGSYTGNGSADGPFVYCGGRPAFVMIKRTDNTNDWYIHNTSTNSTNPSQLTLLANTSDIEGSLYNHIDILSNGFKCRKSDAGTNASGGTYIFACWMESPFQTANAK